MNRVRRVCPAASAGFVMTIVAVAGCSTGPRMPQLGMSLDSTGRWNTTYELRTGDLSPDFRFVSDAGELRRFSAIRGRVTAVVFDPHADWPACCDWQRLESVLKKFTDPDIPTTIVVIGQSSAPCSEALARIPVSEMSSDRITFICDQNGSIRNWYGANASGKIFVVNNWGKISYIGDYKDRDCLERGVTTVVRAVGEEDYRYRAE